MKRYFGRILTGIGLKKHGLAVYFSITNGWKDLISSSRKKLIPLLVRRRSSYGVYAIDLDSDWLGLGARIVKTLEILLYCEERDLAPLIRYGYQERGDRKADYFGELFSYRLAHTDKTAKVRFTRIQDLDELGWPEDYNKKLKLSSAKELFDKYFFIKPEILAEVNAFCGTHFGGRKFLGVHYRGTDKAGEAPLVAKERLIDHISKVLNERPDLEVIFFSTDDASILQFVRSASLPLPVLFREDAVRSTDGDQFHRKKEISKVTVNRDAIVNMLILSRSAYLLKTASILSDCSVIFNPDIAVRMISRPHSEELTWWPCREIIANQTLNTKQAQVNEK